MGGLPASQAPIRRCAIYTRKSSEEGLEQDFNSLHAQREACEAFIKSQAGEGWRLIKTAYDDGGLSGGTMERPALQRLLADINEGLIDVVVVYKVDRLTRSLTDFAKMVEVFDACGVSFVAVTQQFNTTTSMGRLTLNVLLSFAQFEREVTGERIRDKIAASKQKGMWMGGLVPIGYDVIDRRLVVNKTEAETVREIFRLYLELGSVRLLMEDLNRRGIRSKVRVARNGKRLGGNLFLRGPLYELLSNPIYTGEIRHKGVRHPGLHEPIIERELWESTQLLLREHAARRTPRARKSAASPLTGKLFDESGQSLTPSHAVKGERRYRYYVSRNLINRTKESGRGGWRLPAPEIERTVASAAYTMLSDQAVIANAALAIGLAEHQLPTLFSLAANWMKRLRSDVEFSSALSVLVDRVDLTETGIRVSLRLPNSITEEQRGANAIALVITRVFPMQIRRRGFEMRLVIQGNRAPAPLADLTLIKAIARGRQWADDLLAGRVASVAVIARREGVLPNYIRRLTRLGFLAPRGCRGDRRRSPTAGAHREGSDRTHRTTPTLERAGTRCETEFIALETLAPRRPSQLAFRGRPNGRAEIGIRDITRELAINHSKVIFSATTDM
jgi:site-specific DNA recombinase